MFKSTFRCIKTVLKRIHFLHTMSILIDFSCGNEYFVVKVE